MIGILFLRTNPASHERFLLSWLTGAALFYPACLRYRRFKESRPPESLWRMF